MSAIDPLKKSTSARFLVLGDVILDRYVWGDAERVSPEAPVLVLRAGEEEVRPGGAASVANLLRGWNASVELAGVVGADAAGRTAMALVEDAGLSPDLLHVDDARPTTEKARYVGRADSRHPHQILRVDREDRSPISTQLQRKLIDGVCKRLDGCDAVLVSDYAKGVCTPAVLEALMAQAAKRRIPVIVDPARCRNYAKYSGAQTIKPNRAEAELVSGGQIVTPADAMAAAKELRRRHGFEQVFVTLDSDGIVAASSQGAEHYPTRPRRVYDITGAGDTALAMLGLGRAQGLSLAETASLTNVAAGLQVERWGVALIGLEEIAAEARRQAGGPTRRESPSKIVTLEEAASLAAGCRRRGERVVCTNGCFDLLHVGHVTYLEEARQLGDMLLVAINSDSSVRRLKGPSRPVIHQDDRARMLAALSCVDHVLIFGQSTPHRLLEAVRPDVLVKGGTYAVNEVVGSEVVEAYGGHVTVTGQMDGISTTDILQEMTKRHARIQTASREHGESQCE